MRRQYSSAIALCDEALSLTPDNYKVLRIRSVAFCALNKYRDGLGTLTWLRGSALFPVCTENTTFVLAEDAERVLKAVAYSGDAWYQKGYALFHLKEYSAAVCPPWKPVLYVLHGKRIHPSPNEY